MEVFLLDGPVQVEEGDTRSDLFCLKESLQAEMRQLIADFPNDAVKRLEGSDYQISVCINKEEVTLVLNCREHEYTGFTNTGCWQDALDNLFQKNDDSSLLAEDASLIICPY